VEGAVPTTTYITSVERAMRILEVLDGSQSGLSVSAISRKLNIPKSSVHVIILSLERMCHLVRHTEQRHYTLSLKVYSLGREMMQNMALPEMALEPMKWLVAKTSLASHLAVFEKNQAIYVQKVDGPGFIRFDTFVGKRTNLHCTGVGKVLLAYSPPLLRDHFLSKAAFARYTPKTITSSTLLRKSLDKVRERGYAFDDEEEELEIRCIAVRVCLGLAAFVDPKKCAPLPAAG
jgi:IclR family transcriptional regulator, KDG regulon repressor